MRRVGFQTATTKPQRETMLKRIALTALFVASAAFVGVGVAKAQSDSKKSTQGDRTAPSKKPEIAPPTPKGFCYPPKAWC
jgi:hypothetical protein